jgi:hypothetical protein
MYKKRMYYDIVTALLKIKSRICKASQCKIGLECITIVVKRFTAGMRDVHQSLFNGGRHICSLNYLQGLCSTIVKPSIRTR